MVPGYNSESTRGLPGPGVDGSTWNLRNNNGAVAWAGGAGGAAGDDWTATATATATITGTGATFDFDVTDDVQDWVDGTASNYGWWLLNASESTVSSGKHFATSDHATAAYRPLLVVDYEV